MDSFVSLVVSVNDDGLKGLVDGVGREVFGIKPCAGLVPVMVIPGENREGNVPARPRRTGDGAVLLSFGGIKSGKPS